MKTDVTVVGRLVMAKEGRSDTGFSEFNVSARKKGEVVDEISETRAVHRV